MPSEKHSSGFRITVQPDGPYRVEGAVPLSLKVQIVSEYGEPLAWKKQGSLETDETYDVCRCGQSGQKPFCDGCHARTGFDGTEAADTAPTMQRQESYPGGTHIVVKRDYTLCMESGFCRTRSADIADLIRNTQDTNVRALVIAMVEHCPSGSLTYTIEEGQPDIEPDLPQEVAVTTEICAQGPIAGPLWVQGGIPVERADGQPLETRNRVTLCRCGQSHQKPLCDGTHRSQCTPQADLQEEV